MLKKVKNILPGFFLVVLLALVLEFLNYSTSSVIENTSYIQNLGRAS